MICAQAYWLAQAFDANANEFDHTVSSALFAAADTMSENISVEKRSANYYFVNSNASVTNETVDTLIRKELAARNIQLDYEIGIYNAEDDSLIHVTTVKSTANIIPEYATIEADAVQKNFAVMFPSRNNFLLGQSDFMAFALLIIALMIWFGYQYYQIKAGETKNINNHLLKVANCSLDVHNQQLTIGQSNYQLTYKENQILKLFFENPNQVIERKVFLENVWEQDGFFVARSMDVFISKIRKYLKEDGKVKIENLRSIGYKMVISK
mgnify:CR=1 FL=1